MPKASLKQMLRVLIVAFEIELRQNLTDGFVLFGIILQPMIIAFMALWMLKDQVADYAIFVVVGSGMTGLWTTLLFNGGNSITSERWTGTLESLVASPTPLRLVVFGKILANITQALFSMIFCYAFISLIIGFALPIAQPLQFAISAVLMVFAFVTFGLVVGSMFVLNPDVRNFQNGLEFVVYILSGFLFPIALLPGWSTPFSYLLTTYWAAQALHGSSQGTLTFSQIGFHWAMMALFSALYIVFSKYLFRFVLKKAREDATLNMH